MFRFFAKNRRSGDGRHLLSGETKCFTILPAGRASVHPEGAVFLNVERGIIFKSNRVGSRIWEGVLRRESLAHIAAQISREYAVPEQQAKEDTAKFLAQLETEGFLIGNVAGAKA